MEKKLTRSNNKMLCGVCGGIAKYFGIDPTLVRLGTAFLSLFYGVGICAYIVAAVIIPKESEIINE